MVRKNIDFGIDLGTTNSSIALFEGKEVTVFTNRLGESTTPSVVRIDKEGLMQFGRPAKNFMSTSPKNVASEFKRMMGTDHEYHFAASEKDLTPVELSAEVLKSLLGDVQHLTGEVVNAAVITIPAAFGLQQQDATTRAAGLAGLTQCPLLVEPIAASYAYGFQGGEQNAHWIVYDLGGGTFDVAVMQLHEGYINVVNHEGDPLLGGKDIDIKIVDNLLLPAVKEQCDIKDFDRGDARYEQVYIKLKLLAEDAKIALSRDESVGIDDPGIIQDKDGEWRSFYYKLERSEIEPLMAPIFEKTIGLLKKVLADKGLKPDQLDKIILVGGPTQTPLLRDMLKERVGIPLEYSINPLVVVARGAAIFARTQQIEGAVEEVVPGTYAVKLDYKALDSDQHPFVSGQVVAAEGEHFEGFTIQFVDQRTKTSSGLAPLFDDGAFSTHLKLEKGDVNIFEIELKDATGTIHKTTPATIEMTLGPGLEEEPLLHSVGVELASGEMQVFLEKGAAIPCKKMHLHQTTVALQKGESGTILRIPVREGENVRRANRNRKIGVLQINGTEIRRDLPIGSEIDLTVEISKDKKVTAKAYIEYIDEYFSDVFEFESSKIDVGELQKQFGEEKKRFSEQRKSAQEVSSPLADRVLDRLEKEQTVQELNEAVLAAIEGQDPAAPMKCEHLLLEFRSAVDELEDALKWPALVDEAQEQASVSRDFFTSYGSEDEKTYVQALIQEMNAAIEAEDANVVQRKMEQLKEKHDQLETRLAMDQPIWWMNAFLYLESQASEMTDPDKAARLCLRGAQAIDRDDTPALQRVVQELAQLLPAAARATPPAGFEKLVERSEGTTMPKR